MAVEFITGYDRGGDGDHSFVGNNDATRVAAAGEAACGGIQSVEKLMDMISEQKHEENDDYSSLEKQEFAGVAVSILDNNNKPRTRLLGHARFRRAPSTTTLLPNNLQLQQMDHEKETINATRFFELSKEKDGFSPQQRSKEEQVSSSSAFKLYCPTSILPPLPQRNSNNYHDYPSRFSHNQKNNNVEANNGSSTSIDFSTTNSCTYLSTLTNNIDDDHSLQIQRVSLNKGSSSYMQKPPLSNSSLNKRKCNSLDNNVQSSSSKCHCYKKRKSKLKRVIRVAAISSKTADIPSDDFSWRKYGQKPIKGSPHPRGYYKCSSVRGCPARKHVERAVDDPNMLVVTYEGEHNHTLTHDDYANDAVILQSS